MIVRNCHTNACLDAWIHCEQLLANIESAQSSLAGKIKKVVDECALICMGTFHALNVQSINLSRYAILCIGICEECAELCEELHDEIFKYCAKVCRRCSETISELIAVPPEAEI